MLSLSGEGLECVCVCICTYTYLDIFFSFFLSFFPPEKTRLKFVTVLGLVLPKCMQEFIFFAIPFDHFLRES